MLRDAPSRVVLMDSRVNECYPGFFVLYFWDGIMALEEDQFILIDDPLPDVDCFLPTCWADTNLTHKKGKHL